MKSKQTSKTQRTIRLSYADRVLGAVVTIRRGKKKRAIHINTLRAQVRKSAELQRNPLGPQWSTWVGRAVTKLEDQGVLQEDRASGNICLTPRAKRVLKDAHQDFHAQIPSTAQEERLWKSINTQLLTPSTPFKRRRSPIHGIHDDDDDDDDTPADTPTGRAERSRKRHKGISGMSKAELRNELERLRKANEETQAKLEAAISDTDRNAEDARKLKAELARREDEIGGVRLELDDIRIQASTLGYATPRSGGYRSSEPPSSPTTYLGPALRDSRRDTLLPFRKRNIPTPRTDDENESDDPFGLPDVASSPNSFSESTQPHSSGIFATPRPSEVFTPLVLGNSEDPGQACGTISALEQQVIEKAKIARRAVLDRDSLGAVVVSLREQVQSFERAIIAEKLAVAGLKDDLQMTSERRDAFEAAANAKDREIQRLEQEASSLRRRVGEYVALEGKLSELESTLFDTRTKLSIAQEDVSQLTTSLATSQVTRVGLLAQITSFESSLAQHWVESAQELSDLRGAQAFSLADKQLQVSELEPSLAVAESSIAELQERLKIMTSSMEDERNALRIKISSLQRSLEESSGAVGWLESSNESSRLALQNVTKELDGKRGEVDALQVQFLAESQRSATLANALEEAQGQMEKVEKEIVAMRVAKRADEEAIRRSTAIYSKLRDFHAECLAEMDGLMGMPDLSDVDATHRPA